MCGIFGSVGAPLNEEAVAGPWPACATAARGQRRGPPRRGGAGPHRLRIIDLSPAGAQPMATRTSSVWVTFNGEIYNFQELRRELEARATASAPTRHRGAGPRLRRVGRSRWPSASTACSPSGSGTSRATRLLLARDRAGKKPLFYAQHEGRFLFASEIKALFAAGVPLELSPAGVVGYLAYGYARRRHPYQGVSSLPAHRCSAGAGPGPRQQRYWQVDFQARSRRRRRPRPRTIRTCSPRRCASAWWPTCRWAPSSREASTRPSWSG
jgi:asparagine synthase (glutamine-hydrolysing)